MPSNTEPQARFFAACAHGAGYASCPPAKVSRDFNQADKGSALLSSAMKHKHAAGGSISPLASLVGNPMTMRSTSPRMGQPLGNAGRMRMPHVPLADTMHNIDQHMAGARAKLPKLKAKKGGRAKRFDEGGRAIGHSSPGSPGVGGAVKDAVAALRDYLIDRPRREIQAARTAHENAIIDDTDTAQQATRPDDYATGGPVAGLSENAKGAVKTALTHLANKDASSAAATLHASPEAMQHPVVRLAAHALRTGTGLAPATQQLTGMGQ